MNRNWMIIALGALGLGVGWQLGTHQANPSIDQSAEISHQTLPDEKWDNLDGGQSQLTQWKGKVLVINHWATWCEPCRKEIPMFMDFRRQYVDQGFELIGMAHDNLENVRRYVDSMGMDYPQLLAGEIQGRKWLAALNSNGSLPLTLVFDRAGQLRAKKLGLMSETELRKAVVALL